MRSSAADAPPRLHGLPPIVDARSRVLILGSFPSVQSIVKREYYGNPLNQFWRLIGKLFDIEALAPYERRVAELLQARVAVWDVIAACSREGSGDDAIKDAEANRILELMEEHSNIRFIAFNGSTAWLTARRLVPEMFRMPDLHCERMPSTSPKHATRSLEEKAAVWAQLRECTGDDG